jgi:hypothetical protein
MRDVDFAEVSRLRDEWEKDSVLSMSSPMSVSSGNSPQGWMTHRTKVSLRTKRVWVTDIQFSMNAIWGKVCGFISQGTTDAKVSYIQENMSRPVSASSPQTLKFVHRSQTNCDLFTKGKTSFSMGSHSRRLLYSLPLHPNLERHTTKCKIFCNHTGVNELRGRLTEKESIINKLARLKMADSCLSIIIFPLILREDLLYDSLRESVWTLDRWMTHLSSVSKSSLFWSVYYCQIISFRQVW